MDSAKPNDLDEGLYSRQLYVFGHEAQRRLASASVLLIGLNGLGVETAKNIILAGVKTVTLHDNTAASYDDMSAQFYITPADLGQPRAIPSGRRLSELNPYVSVTVLTDPVTTDIISQHTVVVLVDQSWEQQLQISEFCHLRGIAVLTGDARGVFGTVFVDLGDNFEVMDSTGEEPVTCVIEGITQDDPAVVTVLEENRHGLETGDCVSIAGIAGMTQLNGAILPVIVRDAHSFTIPVDTRGFSPYQSGGYVTPQKQPVTLKFRSLADSVLDPGVINIDVAKMESAPVLHLAWRAMHRFREVYNGALPLPGDPAQAQALVDLARIINGAETAAEPGCGSVSGHLSAAEFEAGEKLLRQFAICCRGIISPVCSLVGGVLAQETLKACSGKFTPLQQWFYFNGADCLPDAPLSPDEVHPTGTRYDGQIMVLGRSMQQKLFDTTAFLVGAGAIGCEMLKVWAMMGLGSGSGKGGIHVTDMDQIERSNLSRQFLFRNSDIGHLKSAIAVKAVKSMNSSLRAISYESRLGTESEALFGDDFFDKLDIVCAALDNVEARLYLDQRCLLYHRPLFESGTLGAKGHTQVVLPGLTEHYGATRDPPEKSIPLCTLKSFPNRIEHTLQWAREYFEETFKQIPEHANRYLAGPVDFQAYLQSQNNAKLDILAKVNQALNGRPTGPSDCLQWARAQFEDLFLVKIKQLLYNLPIDKVGSDGTPFWSGAKLPPKPLQFDLTDSLHTEFVLSMASLRAAMYSVVPPSETIDTRSLLQALTGTVLPVFRAETAGKVALTEEEAKEEAKNAGSTVPAGHGYQDIDTACKQLLSELPPLDAVPIPLQAADFDKDLDAHMRVVAAAANLRARCYGIPEADLHRARGIAGKIIPAIATTTALVAGLSCLEMLKYIQRMPLARFANTFSNLALPMFTSAEPDPPKVQESLVKGEKWRWTQWDRIELSDPKMKLSDLITHVEREYNAELAMLSAGVSILYSAFSNPKKAAERKGMTLPAIYESVVKKAIPSSQKYLVFELILNDIDSGEEIEVPYLRLQLRP